MSAKISQKRNQNGTNIDQKRNQNRTKIKLKWNQYGAKMIQNGTKIKPK